MCCEISSGCSTPQYHGTRSVTTVSPYDGRDKCSKRFLLWTLTILCITFLNTDELDLKSRSARLRCCQLPLEAAHATAVQILCLWYRHSIPVCDKDCRQFSNKNSQHHRWFSQSLRSAQIFSVAPLMCRPWLSARQSPRYTNQVACFGAQTTSLPMAVHQMANGL